jgi:Secretion system C-terminal sorting domain
MRFFSLFGFFLFSQGIFGQSATLNQVIELPDLISESSGLAKDSNGIFWSHNDSDNDAILVGFNLDGQVIYTIEVTNSSNIDWEDLSIVNDTLIICDCGNNLNTRTNLRILKVPMGSIAPGNNFREAEIINFSYAEQTAFPPKPQQLHFDLEAMACTADSIYLFSKNRTQPSDGLTYQYVMPNRSGNYPNLERKGQFNSGTTQFADWITGAALNDVGDLALLSASKIIIYRNFTSNPRIQHLAEIIHYNGASQIEAICWNDECSVWITDEDNAIIFNDNNLYSLEVCSAAGNSTKPKKSILTCSPNPVDSFLTIHMEEQSSVLPYQIIDSNGNVMLKGLIETNQTSINVRNLPSGQYYMLSSGSSKPLIYCAFVVAR